MSDQTARQMAFPAACASCGGRISEPVSFCPHCGARARLAAVVEALREPHGSEDTSRSPTAAARFEPPMRSFEPTDFEGDLDAPPLDPSASPPAMPNGDPVSQPRAPAFLRFRQWGLKGGMGLILGAFVVLYGGVTVLHRYDQPAISPGSEDGLTKTADGSIASNGSSDSNRTAAANNELGALAPSASMQGTSPSELGATPPNADAGISQAHPTNRAGAAHSRHSARGRTHSHARTHAHAYANRPRLRSADPIYLHSDVQSKYPSTSKQADTRLASAAYHPNALRII